MIAPLSQHLRQLLVLKPGDWASIFPFFGLYGAVFIMMALMDGVTLSLFITHLGSDRLPQFYAIGAGVNILANLLYLKGLARCTSEQLFRYILGLTLLAILAGWLGLTTLTGNWIWLLIGGLFSCREVALTFALMHFGTLLQDYFSRETLDRTLPIIYSGGRLGSLTGGILLGVLSTHISVLHILPVAMLFGMLALWIIYTHVKQQPLTDDALSIIASQPPEIHTNILRNDSLATTPTRPQTMWQSALFRYFLWATLVFILCRWLLNYQYNQVFDAYFDSANDLAHFLGWYTAIAMAISLLIQLFIVTRIKRWLGLGSAFLTYSFILVLSVIGILAHPVMAWAVMGRFVENEFRMGYRNPMAILITNRFERPWRKQARAMSMGLMIPLATLFSSGLLMLLIPQSKVIFDITALFSCALYILATWHVKRQVDLA